ncbi:MAG: hypothetical protein JWR59_246, partial [Brevundimonas sp.]|nr:hypothetical protein [Brevundimonas sp.]
IGTAGWSTPKAVAPAFPTGGTGLERYAARFDAVEINTTFYRSHRESTYVRWREAAPAGFRFAVKLRRTITHEARLAEPDGVLAAFCNEIAVLGDTLGPLLVQLPPSLSFAAPAHDAFFARLRRVWPGQVVCEPRHPSWFESEPDAMLSAWRVGRVATDPVRHPAASAPGGWPGIGYWRFHGSPKVYYSSYEPERLAILAGSIRESEAAERWCVFDNTTSGAATANALDLQARLGPNRPPEPD